METRKTDGLSNHLDVLQQKLMDLWDKDSTSLEDHVEHWSLLRREAALLTAARVSGVSRAGHQVVPALASCEAKARDAIQMHLLMKSLQSSPYASEPWTLSQTSAEMWRTSPRDTFKKKGYTVEVMFGHEESNRMHYTAWGEIYAPSLNAEGWQKVATVVDSRGLHYTAWGSTVTFVDFSAEADKFGGRGDWEVRVKGTVIDSHAPVTSSTDSCCQSIPQPADDDTTYSTTDCVDLGSRTPEADTRRGRTTLWPVTSTPAPLPVACRPLSAQGHSYCVNSQPRRQDCNCGGAAVNEASPVIILKGEPNQLKCLRFRLNRNHRPLFSDISSTWCWSSSRTGEGTRGRVTVTFINEEQRNKFKAKVPIPKGVQCVHGYMPT